MIYDNYINLNTVGGSSNAYSLRLTITLNSQDKLNNTSNITIAGYIRTNASYWGYSSFYSPYLTCTLTPNTTGSAITLFNNQIGAIPTNNNGVWVQFGSWTGNVAHNSDGSLVLNNVTLTYAPNTTGYSYLPASGSVVATNVEITKIPRNSTIESVETYEDESDGVVITINKSVDTYYDIVQIYYGSTLLNTYEGVESGDRLQLSEEQLETFYALSSTDNSPKLTYQLTTYTDNTKETQIGETSTINGAFYFGANAFPKIITFPTYSDVNSVTSSLTNDNQIIINEYSTIELTLPKGMAQANKGATLVKYVFQDMGSVEYSEEEIKYTINNYNYGSPIIISVIDSRGYVNNINLTINTIVNYNQLPLLTNVKTQRANGVETTTYLSFNAKLWNGEYNTDRPNTIAYFAYRVKTKEENWQDQTWYDMTKLIQELVSTQSVDNIVIDYDDEVEIHSNGTGDGFSIGTEYDIQLKISDGYGTTLFNSDYETTSVDSGLLLDTYYRSDTGYKYAVNGLVDTTLKDGLQVNGSLYLINEEVIEITPANLSVPYVLYENTSGTQGEITLSDDISNYKYIEILHGIVSGTCTSTKSIVGKTPQLFTMAQVYGSDYYYLRSQIEQTPISGTTLSRGEPYISTMNVNNSTFGGAYVSGDPAFREFIFMVIGYK